MISKEAWQRLTENIDNTATEIARITRRSLSEYTVEECVKSGRVSTSIQLITELENQLRVLKRRLITSLPAEEQSKYPTV